MENEYTRSAGVLMPIPALHGPCGIGVLGAEALEFIDFVSDCGFHAWQILPVEHTGAGSSPYKCVSAFAGEPMMIDPRELCDMGLITPEELEERNLNTSDDLVNYGAVYENQWRLLKTAHSKLGGTKPHSGFNPVWLDTYALYMALKRENDDLPWYEWHDERIRSGDETALSDARDRLADEIDLYKFVQWIFDRQWQRVRDYAKQKDVAIIGDMPFYVSEDSAEVWSRRDLFDASPTGEFAAIGGAPPDYFNPEGQRWGNPVYNWKLLKKEGYTWWIERFRVAFERYDIVRLDHFRGFESYWRIPSDSETAKDGVWARGPGMPLFRAVKEVLGDLPVIAEDLGAVTDQVESLRRKTGFPGMRVLQFGFDGNGMHLPHNYPKDCIAYTGTHDNTTLLAWMFEIPEQTRELAKLYLGFYDDWTQGGPNCKINTAWIRTLFLSCADVIIAPIQDLLGYGADTRTNTPGTPDGNWRFRIKSEMLKQIDCKFYNTLCKVTQRNNAVYKPDRSVNQS